MRRAQRVRDGDVDHVVLEARDQLKVRVSAVLKEHGGGFHLCVAAGEARDIFSFLLQAMYNFIK